MTEISFPRMGMGLYSYGVAAKGLFSFGASFSKIDSQRKIQSIATKIFPSLLTALATSSWALIWTHSVKWIQLGSYLPLVEKMCSGSFTLLYAGESCREGVNVKSCYQSCEKPAGEEEELKSHLWKLVGNISFFAWSMFSLMGVVAKVSVNPIIPFLPLLSGLIAFTLSALYEEAAQKIRDAYL